MDRRIVFLVLAVALAVGLLVPDVAPQQYAAVEVRTPWGTPIPYPIILDGSGNVLSVGDWRGRALAPAGGFFKVYFPGHVESRREGNVIVMEPLPELTPELFAQLAKLVYGGKAREVVYRYYGISPEQEQLMSIVNVFATVVGGARPPSIPGCVPEGRSVITLQTKVARYVFRSEALDARFGGVEAKIMVGRHVGPKDNPLVGWLDSLGHKAVTTPCSWPRVRFTVSQLYTREVSFPAYPGNLSVALYHSSDAYYRHIWPNTLLVVHAMDLGKTAIILHGLYKPEKLQVRLFVNGAEASPEHTIMFRHHLVYVMDGVVDVRHLKVMYRDPSGKYTSRNWKTTEIALGDKPEITQATEPAEQGPKPPKVSGCEVTGYTVAGNTMKITYECSPDVPNDRFLTIIPRLGDAYLKDISWHSTRDKRTFYVSIGFSKVRDIPSEEVKQLVEDAEPPEGGQAPLSTPARDDLIEELESGIGNQVDLTDSAPQVTEASVKPPSLLDLVLDYLHGLWRWITGLLGG